MKKLPWLQIKLLFSSLAQPCPTLCDQHARPPCSSPTPGACSNSCALSWWCHQTISFLVVPFSSYLQSFTASRSFQMSQLLASDGQSIGVSASVLPMYIQDWFPLALTGLIFLLSKGFSSGPGIELVSPALLGRFLTTGLPGTPPLFFPYFLNMLVHCYITLCVAC